MKIRTIVRFSQLMARRLSQDPRSIPFSLRWVQSLRVGHSAVRDGQPAITFKALAWLDAYLRPEMSVFEYGTGGSTLHFARRVRRVVSVEHHREWHAKMTTILGNAGINNCELILCEPETDISSSKAAYGPGSYSSTNPQYQDVRFEAYVHRIDRYPDKSFDLVLVDGRSRSSCLVHALPKINPNGYLMLDNSDRQEYQAAKTLLSKYARTDFRGIGPYDGRIWQTSVWRVRHAGE